MSRNPKALALGLGYVDSHAFRAWFAGSQIVDVNGLPMVVHHGTKADFTSFEFGRITKNYSFLSYQTSRKGVFFTPDESFAKEFSDENGKTVSVYLSIKNPLDLSEGYPDDFYRRHIDSLAKNNLLCMRPEEMWEMLDDGFPGSDEFFAAVKADGYDGLKMVERNGESELRDVFVAFSPTQIKSATGNLGTFCPDNPDIRCSRSPRQR